MTGDWTEPRTLLPGLPRFLWRKPERLLEMLGLNRKARRRLAAMAPAWRRSRVRRDLKAERGRVSRRDVELTLIAVQYSDPIWREIAWEEALAGKVEQFPSLLFEILRDFVQEVRRDPTDSGREEDRIAERAWAAAQRDLDAWEELDEGQRERCVLLAFAVASVLDAPIVLAEAMETAPDIRDEFEGLVPMAMMPEPPATDEWSEECGKLSSLAVAAAGPPPDPTVLGRIKVALATLHILDARIAAERESEAQVDLAVEVERMLGGIPKSPEFAWLADARLTSVREQWGLEVETLYAEEAAAEEERLRSAFEPAVEAVRHAATACGAVRDRVTACRESRPVSPWRRRAWRASLAELQAEEQEREEVLDDSRQALLHAISPFGRWPGESSDEDGERESDPGERPGSSDGGLSEAPKSEKTREERTA